jgi:hypothetical protein
VQGRTVYFIFLVNSPPAKASPAPLVSTTFSGGNWMAGNSFTMPSEINVSKFRANVTLQQLHILQYLLSHRLLHCFVRLFLANKVSSSIADENTREVFE